MSTLYNSSSTGSIIAGPGLSPRNRMEITVQRSRLVSPSSGKPFTMFEVEVLNGKSIYTIYRRYSQFLDLYEKLKRRFGTYAVPQRFPGKKFRNNLSPAAVDKRHMKLKAWCEAVAASETLAKSMELREFIKNDNATTATAISSPGALPPISSQQQQNLAAPSAPAQIIARLHSGSRTWTDSGNSLLEIGFLYVWSGTSWKSRHLILRANALYEFKTPKHKNPSHIYIIEDAKVRKLSTIEGLFQFEVCIQKPQPKKLILAAKSEATLENWMLSIRNAAKRQEVEDTVEAPTKARSLEEEDSTSKMSSRLPKIGTPTTTDSYESAGETSSVDNSDTEKTDELAQQTKIFGAPLSRTLYFRFVTKVLRRLRGLDNRTLDELFASEDYNIKAATALKPFIDRGECKFRRVDPPTLVGLLLLFLYELPEPLLTFELFRCFYGTTSITSDLSRINILKSLLNSLPKVNVQSLRKIINFLSYVVEGNPFEAIEMRVREVVRRNSAEWKSIETNRKQQLTEFLGNTFGPLILRPPANKLKEMGLSQIEIEQASSNLVQFMINNSACIFREHGSRVLLKNTLLQIEDKADDSTPPLRRNSLVTHADSGDVEMIPKKPSENPNRISVLVEERKVVPKSPVLYRRSTIITSLKGQQNNSQDNFDNLPFVEKFKMIKQASEEPEANSEATGTTESINLQ